MFTIARRTAGLLACTASLVLASSQALAVTPAQGEADGAPMVQPITPADVELVEVGQEPTTTDAETLAYWTPERKLAAVAIDSEGTTDNPSAHVDLLADPGLGKGAPGKPYDSAGIKTAGTFFWSGRLGGKDDHTCTGVVVKSPGKKLVLTAAHCNLDGAARAVFVPGFYVNGNTPMEPAGTWVVDIKRVSGMSLKPPRPHSEGLTDVHFVPIKPDSGGRLLQNVVGGHTPWTDAPGQLGSVEQIGYPHKQRFQRHCRNNTTGVGYAGYTVYYIRCANMPNGVSGGPWLTLHDGGWQLVAITGGYLAGGYLAGGYRTSARDDNASYGVPMHNALTSLINRF